ncbi:hypothetical protein CVU82_01010 [Candidatus Falkowbacteria bacterium HGW-Falkowbacteria-1]|uniref:DUF5673 domain-containing protein n=1 Tax=Candidatus Falkowbacteria bacterium HGW-Falkowbacteria-1 TaxID=2013768 RepID=A0A2N2EAL9_9BACT|nr:MAG: hypothetical protein CVU82_01010 [Candidatus Falkowbacteria bacterium HGW-Falkowbacteria-1]
MSKHKNKKVIENQKIERKEAPNKNDNTEQINLNWEINEFVKHQRSKRWYIIASIITLGLIIWAITDKNYLFALIMILFSALIVFYDSENPKRIKIELKYNGLFVGQKFYKFESISKFYIIYKPEENVKKIFFEFKNPINHRLTVPLENENPIMVRNHLLQYLEEDLEKENEPLSEGLSKILKL